MFGFILIGMAIYFLEPLFPSKILYNYALATLSVIAGIYLAWLDKNTGATVFKITRNVVGAGFIILGIVFAFCAVLTSGFTSIIFVALFGLSNAIVWPAIWPLAIHNLGSFINKGSALLVMAISGGALLPLLWGKLADVAGSQEAYWIMIPCYLMILFYAIRGYKLKSWK